MKSLRGMLMILGATTFWGASATLAKYLFSERINPVVLVQMRMTLSFLILAVVFLGFRRDLLRVRAVDLFHLALIGIVGAAGSNITYYVTINQTNVATAILLQYLAPLLVLAYAAVTGEEEITLLKTLAGVVSLGGCFLAVAGERLSLLAINRLGLLSGLGSAFCWGFTNVWLRRLLKVYNVWTCLFYAFLFASLFWAVVNPPWKIAGAHYSTETWKVFLGFAVISILIPHTLYFSGLQYLTAGRAIITASFEPVVAIGTAFVFLGETLSPVQVAGGVLVVGAIVLLQIRQEASPAARGAVPLPGGE